MKPYLTYMEYHRRGRGLSLTEAAKRIGISKDTLSRFERLVNRERKPYKDIQKAIEDFYGHKWKHLRSLCR